MIVDGSGNIYISGTLSANNHYTDGFVQKISPQGIILWTKVVGVDGLDNIKRMSLDVHNNLYVAGMRWGYGPIKKAGILLKILPNGEIDWIKSLQTDEQTMYAGRPQVTQQISLTGVTVQRDGKIIVVGEKSPLWDDWINPNNQKNEVFIAKYSSENPTLALNTGTAQNYAFYESGNNTKILSFKYVIGKNDISDDLDYIDNSVLK